MVAVWLSLLILYLFSLYLQHSILPKANSMAIGNQVQMKSTETKVWKQNMNERKRPPTSV